MQSLQTIAVSLRLRVLFAWFAVRHHWEDFRDNSAAVWRAAKVAGTYGSEVRLHGLTMVIGLWAMLPFQSLSPFILFGRVLPEQSWALGMFGVALYGFAQMLATKGNSYSNEDGRTRALQMTCAAFVFLSWIFWTSSYPKIGTVVYPYVALTSWSLFMRMVKHGPR